MKAVDWATNIFKNEMAEEATNISIPSLIAYYRSNVNDLNNMLGTCFTLNNTQGVNFLELIDGKNINCLINDDAANVYKYIYMLSYYNRLIRNLTGVGAVNSISQIQSDGGIVRFTERHQLARVYLDLRKSINQDLKNLVNKYKMRNQTAKDVTGDDIFVSYQSQIRESGDLYEQDII
jgi:hypothetical protein